MEQKTQMAEQTEKTYIHLAQTIFSNIELFELQFRAKTKKNSETSSWDTIATNMEPTIIKKPQEEWRGILTKFVSGNLKEENETLFEEVKKIIRCFPIVRNALDGAENKDNQQSEPEEVVTSTTPRPSAAEGKRPTPDLDDQNKTERWEKIDELTGFAEKLKLEISRMERGLHELNECFSTVKLNSEQWASKLDDLKKIE